MSVIVISILGVLAAALFFDGIGSIVSTRHYESRQNFFRMTVKAPENLDAPKYYLISRVIAGLGSMGAGCVVLFWIWEYIGTL
jgi:hypothetical protein